MAEHDEEPRHEFAVDPDSERTMNMRMRTVDHGDHKHVMFNASDVLEYLHEFLQGDLKDHLYADSSFLLTLMDFMGIPEKFKTEVNFTILSQLNGDVFGDGNADFTV